MRITILFAFSILSLPAVGATFDSTTHSVSNWKDQAKSYLGLNDQDFSSGRSLRCAKLNNYWCLKDIGWEGGLGHDQHNHTAFTSAAYGARAAVRNLRTAYVKRERRTAFQIMSAYAPPNDCIGSIRLVDGSCKFGLNPTKEYAVIVAKGITEDPNADLQLFDDHGKATEALVTLLKNICSYETGGLKVADQIVRTGICLEDQSCRPDNLQAATVSQTRADQP